MAVHVIEKRLAGFFWNDTSLAWAYGDVSPAEAEAAITKLISNLNERYEWDTEHLKHGDTFVLEGHTVAVCWHTRVVDLRDAAGAMRNTLLTMREERERHQKALGEGAYADPATERAAYAERRGRQMEWMAILAVAMVAQGERV